MQTNRLALELKPYYLRDEGIKRASENADKKIPDWNVKALEFLRKFALRNKGKFKIEDIRKASKWIVPEPPSSRAWGGIAVAAKNRKYIKHVGASTVKNKTAHQCFSADYISLISK